MVNKEEGRKRKSMLHHNTENGQGLIEYSLAIVLIAVVAMAILVMLGPAIADLFSNIVTAV
jgi:pilus assembly protein Flp/PilA